MKRTMKGAWKQVDARIEGVARKHGEAMKRIFEDLTKVGGGKRFRLSMKRIRRIAESALKSVQS